jgi:HSP20 family protein
LFGPANEAGRIAPQPFYEKGIITMNASTSERTAPSATSWKTPALAIAAAVLAATVGVESYLLYRSPRPPAAVAAKEASSVAPRAPATPMPNFPLGDWPAPLASGSPWDQLNSLRQQMDQMFNNTLNRFPLDGSDLLSSMSSPNFDMRDDGDHYAIRLDMPGADKSTIKVNVEGRIVTISGERTAISESSSADKVLRSERNLARFERTVQLPGPVKPASVDAKYENGVLTLNLPKADEVASSTQVPVH